MIAARLPFDGQIHDFDIVVHDGRPLLVGTHDRSRRAFTWDPASDEWTVHELDAPALPEADSTELTALGAAVVDGRIVIGGGGDHQGFAQWDLESGQLRLSAQEGGVIFTSAAVFGDRTLLVVGLSSGPTVQLWDPSVAEADEELEEDLSPYDSLVEVEELEAVSYAASAVAAGMLRDRPVLVANGMNRRVLVWDIDAGRALATFNRLENQPHDFALVASGDRTRVVAVGGRSLLVGDPDTGDWDEPLTVPGGDISCLDAGLVNGRAVAVTGAKDGTVCAWDLAGRRLLGEPFRGQDEIFAIRMTELNGHQVVISAGRENIMRMWELTP
ncbi:WD40 repeat domain-containing protein [Actinomadura sp. 9N407]|uniref:WD40 repeat domain-containing protein n=1 Tax=Actinomadura sp. 9N407 TaxID=3375154 RepID=UPI00379AAB84